MTHGRLFQFDGVDSTLELLPLAVHRLLDQIGARLTLEGWRSLRMADRRTLLRLGSAATIDATSAREVLQRATPSAQTIDPTRDPPDTEVPEELLRKLGAEKALSNAVWSSLEPLERWVLQRVAQSEHAIRLPSAYDEIIGEAQHLTHLNPHGEAHMVEIAAKPITLRRAVAQSTVTMSDVAHRCLLEGNAPKGDVLGTARIAGIMAAKQTSRLIPLCHPVQLTHVEVSLVAAQHEPSVAICAEVTAVDRTGVEMEAMVAASVAALTVYDMLKAVDRRMVLGPTRLIEKSGGKSGEFRA